MTQLTQRENILSLVDQAVADGASREKACQVIGIASSTLRRWRPGETVESDRRPDAVRPAQSHQLSDKEREHIICVCNQDEFASLPPSQIVPMLADTDQYIGSESTIYRVLRAHNQLHHRGRSQARKSRGCPTTHTATAPNQVWMLDVTWLPSRTKGLYYYLYMIEDLYSRYGVHWDVFEAENGENTKLVIEQAIWREQCILNPPTLHNDNGRALKSQTVHQKLLSLGIKPSHSRPRVSNDNAYIESFFRTLKYCPMWPSRGFESIEQARQWVHKFMHWYNDQHRHSAIKFVTPAQRHSGEDKQILQHRSEFYAEQQRANPSRWRGKTRDWSYIEAVTLNPEKMTNAVS